MTVVITYLLMQGVMAILVKQKRAANFGNRATGILTPSDYTVNPPEHIIL